MMYYRGKRVSLDGKEPIIHRFRLDTGKRRFGEKRETKFSFKLFWVKETPVEREKKRSSDFYRPSMTLAGNRTGLPPKKRFKFSRPAAWFGRWALAAMGVGAILGGALWAKGKAGNIFQGLVDLKLSRIEVEGIHYLNESQVIEAAKISMGQDMLQMDLDGICGRIRQLDWVEGVYAERRLPTSLLLSVRERQPVALLDSGSLYGIDKEGRVLSPSAVLAREDLPLVSGLKVPPEAAGTTRLASEVKPAIRFFNFLKKEDAVLAQDVSEVNLSEEDCLKVTFIDGLETEFNMNPTDAELKRMAAVISDLGQKGKSAATMDFRYRDMVLVKTRR